MCLTYIFAAVQYSSQAVKEQSHITVLSTLSFQRCTVLYIGVNIQLTLKILQYRASTATTLLFYVYLLSEINYIDEC